MGRREFFNKSQVPSSADTSMNAEGATAAPERPLSTDQMKDFENLEVDEALAHLIDMGFEDDNINRLMLIKNGLDISTTVNDLIAERDADAAVVREQPRSNSVNDDAFNNSASATRRDQSQSINNGNNNNPSSSFLCDFD